MLYLVVPAVNSSARPPTPERQNAPPRLHGTAASAKLRFQPHLYGVCDPVAQPEVHWSGLLRDRHRAPTLRRHCGGWDSISIHFDFDDERPSGRFHDVQHPSQPQLEASNGSSRSFISRHGRSANPRHRGVGSYERTAAQSILHCFVLRCTLRHGLTHPFDWQPGRHYQTPTSKGRHQLEGRQIFVSCQPTLGYMTSAPRTGLLRQVDSGLPPIPQHNGSIDVDVT